MNMMDLPFSQACENNKPWILQVLQRHLDKSERPLTVLEIGGGTGQHAEHFARHLPQLTWQSSDVIDNVPMLSRRLMAAALPNLPPPLQLDARDAHWPLDGCDHVFSANTLHIMSALEVESLFRRLPQVLRRDGLLFVYGPFRYGGEYTSQSNAEFDAFLQQRDPQSGIRDAEWIDELAVDAGLSLVEDNDMPANNQLRIWCHDL